MRKSLLGLLMALCFGSVSYAQNFYMSQSNCTNVTGGTLSYTFGSTASATGNGTLTIDYQGDLDASTEYFDVFDEKKPKGP